MPSLSALSAALVVFLLISPVFTTETTPNDPFRALAIYGQKHPDPTVCSLLSPPSIEPVDSDVLLSFEEWKARQFAMQSLAKIKPKEIPRSNGNVAHANGGKDDQLLEQGPATVPAPSLPPSADAENENPTEMRSPHFRVPLTDRFNYASLDCSARVHLTHKTAKSPSSILSDKKDRYMLSPCGSSKGQNQFVVVELCEDIRIDTVQLANFEFFSGVFKDFTVSVAKTYSTDKEGWTVAGTYKAKNVRGVQSFHPPTSLRDFYRYIRIDFHSHYSNEYYCPISLLRVYGLTHMEQWKWEMWESESIAKRGEVEGTEASYPSEVVDAPELAQISVAEDLDAEKIPLDSVAENSSGKEGALTGSSKDNYASRIISNTGTPTATLSTESAETAFATATAVPGSQANETGSKSVDVTIQSNVKSVVDLPASISETSLASQSTISSMTTNSVSENATTPRFSSSIAIVTASSSSHMAYPPMPPTTGGESIYRTIMNRLTALEANNTLYARYVEEQTAGVREMIRRLGEEVGRLEGLGKAQAQMYQRTVNEWERQRSRLEMEHGELMSRVDYLSDEIVLEKRLGIAQLCLLLAVLLFVGLTRGSRGEAILDQSRGATRINKTVREWGRRHLSFNGDWKSRLKSQSPAPQQTPRNPDAKKDKVEFPSSRTSLPPPPHTSRAPIPSAEAQQIKLMHALASEKRPATAALLTHSFAPLNKRSHTPTALRTPTRQRPATSSSVMARPMIQRANSQGSNGPVFFSGIGPVPKSAKKWARSAHLHEVRIRPNGGARERRRGSKERSSGSRERRRDERENQISPGDGLYTPLSPLRGYPSKPLTGGPQFFLRRKPLYPLSYGADGDESTEGDNWVDTDVEGSELGSDIPFSPGDI
ncbi:hypothetical protein HWV62_11325 [Athelia sp. TMB]|nr:hypothetical protein HWV62_33201 [Athelia sp. TMB]KAF7974746.1 hypothetical protein HWV62_11325 [Athelia sp. TMB]